MQKASFILISFLAVAGCNAVDEDIPADAELSLDEIKDDQIGNRKIDSFKGALKFDDTGHKATIEKSGYKVGYTLRAAKGTEFKLWARGSNGYLPTTIHLYGPRTASGKYAHVKSSTRIQGNAIVYYKPAKEGIYLAVLTSTRKGDAEIGLNCGGGDPSACELGCAVIRLWDPQCGTDGVTYGNKPSAACYDIPIADAGECVDPNAPSCAAVLCAPGTVCELQEVQCITTPCYPQPVCVPQSTCKSIGLCVTGYFWNEETCSCMSDCAFMRCAAGFTCENTDAGAACVPVAAAPCQKTGCSGQICSDTSVITTCEFRDYYACYHTATCERQANGSCGWTQTPALTACLASPPPL
jgi:hypothetical protein